MAIMSQKFNDFVKAGGEGLLQWRGYWKPQHANDTPPENQWSHVYGHESFGMLCYHGVDRFRIKPKQVETPNV